MGVAMKRSWIVAFGLLVGLLGFAAGRGFTDEPKGLSPEMQKEMDEWMKLGAPGEEHRMLAASAGDWTVDGQHFMGPQPTPMKGSAKRVALWENRYVHEEFRGEFMGETYEGAGVVGYDNAEKRYVGTWVDNMSTGIATMKGTYDAATKTYTWNMDPMKGPGGKEYRHRMTVKVVSDKEFTSTMYKIGDEGEQKTMELRYTKK
jgi:hypothetical protein